MTARQVWLNGRIVPADEAFVPAEDRGLLMGEGAFETLRVYGGHASLLDRHFARLLATARQLALTIDWNFFSGDAHFQAVNDLTHANDLPDGRLRITLTTGPEDGPPTVLITLHPLPELPSRWYAQGIDVHISDIRRNPGSVLSGHKTTSYLPLRLAWRRAVEAGAEEALVLNTAGRVAEGATSNVFLVRDGALVTPPKEEGILPGITRQVAIELARERGVGVEERAVATAELAEAEEVFITGSVKEIVPVRRIDGTPVGAGAPGPVCRMLLGAYRERVGNPKPVPN